MNGITYNMAWWDLREVCWCHYHSAAFFAAAAAAAADVIVVKNDIDNANQQPFLYNLDNQDNQYEPL